MARKPELRTPPPTPPRKRGGGNKLDGSKFKMHITIAEKQDPRLLKEVGDLCLSATSQRDRLRRGAAHRFVKLRDTGSVKPPVYRPRGWLQ